MFRFVIVAVVVAAVCGFQQMGSRVSQMRYVIMDDLADDAGPDGACGSTFVAIEIS